MNLLRHRHSRIGALVGLGLLVALVAGLGLAVGPLWLRPDEWWRALKAPWAEPDLASVERIVVWEVRMPRVLLGLAVGAALGVCGAAMQAVFRNPLADPGLLGIAACAAVGAVLAILFPVPWLGVWSLPVLAFLFSLGGTLLIYHLARVEGRVLISVMLLAGIAINAMAGAVTGFLLFLSDDVQLRTITFWTMGALDHASWPAIFSALPLMVVPLILLPFLSRALDAFLLGEAEAGHLGFDVGKIKRRVIVATAISVGAAVAVCGVIGFVGLVVPHLVRLIFGPAHRWLLPGSALLGAGLLVMADLVARLVVAPAQLPLGLVTAMFGAPFFFGLLLWARERQSLGF